MHRRGRGRGKRRRRVLQFLQPCLLLLLQRGEAHGYALLAELERFGFNPERLDPTLVYRALREMEEVEMVESHWDEESQGPRRRVYTILPEGREQLSVWIEDLRRTRNEIDHLLMEFEDQNDEDAV
ncbi:MAG: helix-turn-helix transcriptional regulator [Anaerolineales bacterium]|nr:helix-turn-helix transcriptional regulator [Anaerolineales bacterium]